MSNQHYCLAGAICRTGPATKIHVPRIYPWPSRCFFASGRHRVCEERIRDVTDLLQTKPAQPLCPGEGCDPGICAAPPLIPGVGRRWRPSEFPSVEVARIAAPWLPTSYVSQARFRIVSRRSPGTYRIWCASMRVLTKRIIVPDKYAIHTSVHWMCRSAYVNLP